MIGWLKKYHTRRKERLEERSCRYAIYPDLPPQSLVDEERELIYRQAVSRYYYPTGYQHIPDVTPQMTIDNSPLVERELSNPL